MSSCSFFIKHKILLVIILITLAGCGRKNKHIYEFSQPQAGVARISLPTVEQLSCCFDAAIDQYKLSWKPVQLQLLPEGVYFVGYRIYLTAQSGIKPFDCHVPYIRGAHHVFVPRQWQGRYGIVSALFYVNGHVAESLVSRPVKIK